MEEVVESKTKKEKNPVAGFFLKLLYVILGLIAVIAGWATFSALDKKSPLSMIPEKFAAYLHTDSIYETINPLFDLQAADIFLASDDMSDIRGIFMMLRESEMRNNKYVKYVITRKVDAAFYSVNDIPDTFVASVELGVFSCITRLATFVVPKLKIDGVSYIQQNGIDFFKFVNGENTFYFKPVKNLIIISNNFDYFVESMKGNHDQNYSPEQIELLNKKTNEPIKIVVDAKNLAQSFTKENPLLQKMTSVISDKSLSLLTFKITDNEINLKVEIPLEFTDEIKNDKTLSNVSTLFSKDSSVPDIVSILSSSIQYYTVLNAGTLRELIDAIVPLMPPEQNTEDLLKTADKLCHSLFKLSLDDILYSWTDKEYSVLGIEGLNDPVFAIKISDEKKRQIVFDALLKSILLTENKSLILNGVRIPRIELPSFLQGVLKLLNVSLPKPYYLVYNNYVYFSQSAESISTIYSTFANGTNISYNKNWKSVADKSSGAASISLFYDLERSRPFFITSNSSLSQIIELYTIGKTDIGIKDNSIVFSLNAVSKRAGSLKNIPGFPVQLNGKPGLYVKESNTKKPETIFWLEDEHTLKAMNVKKTQTYSFELPAKAEFEAVSVNSKEMAAVFTNQNEFYLFNDKLEVEKGYPLTIDDNCISRPYLSAPKSYIPNDKGNFNVIENKKVSQLIINSSDFEDVNLQAYYNGVNGVLYERSFLGKVYVLNNGVCINPDDPVILDKIGFDTPALTKEDAALHMGFISQSGEVTIWNIEGTQIQEQDQFSLNGTFTTNLIPCGNYFFALSEQGEVFRINALDGKVLSVQIDNVTAKEGVIAVRKSGDKNYICVGIDGNKSYAFTENLELVSGFPIAACGIPAFADVNGDSYPDCFALTIDGKLNAWNLR